MGIKGIYKEIGPGKRVSLCKLAIEHLEETGQPLRLAIDFAIWSFQAQAARGGAHPAIRTLFYRLVRLLSLTVHPIFVFDGPNKPAFKRHRHSRRPGDTVSAAMAKRLIRLFGFVVHDAPGEAEAECALLQREGVVDAVLSEDVDTIMFGCGRTLRNWSAEGTGGAGSRPPTHVSVYDAAELSLGAGSGAGLDREALVLVALMSGGDYIPEGVPGCGVKVACEAARAGFGARLCRIKRSDPDALRRWREELASELRTNKSGFFRVRHRALTIPEDFPDVEVLRYYTHPVVSQAAAVERLSKEFPPRGEVDIVGLRAFAGETFDWIYKTGAVKFIKVLAPGLLVQALMGLSGREINDPDERARAEAKLARAISTRRAHFSTDATPELRISYIPNDIVGLDLDAEEDEGEAAPSKHGRSGLALNSDNETDGPEDGEVDQAKTGPGKIFDPRQSDLVWVPESVAKLGVPLAVENWEAEQRAKRLAKEKKKKIAAAAAATTTKKTAPTRKSRATKKALDMPAGALDKYLTSTKVADPTKLATKDLEAAAPKKPLQLPEAVAVTRSGSPSRRRKPTGPDKAAPNPTAQASIKTFGKLSEAMAKKAPVVVELLDEDDELEDIRTLGSKRSPEAAGAKSHHHHPPPPKQPTPTPPRQNDRRRARTSPRAAPICIPSSPPAPSPFAIRSKTTTVYVQRASDAGLGYVREVEVTREEAQRMLDAQTGGWSGVKPGGGGGRRTGGVRMWRESEVSIVDLTGED